MNGFEVDFGVLDGIANILGNASANVDDLGRSVPSTPDAGDGSPAMAGILAHLLENACTLILGLAGASEDVTLTNSAYQQMDHAAHEEIQRATGER